MLAFNLLNKSTINLNFSVSFIKNLKFAKIFSRNFFAVNSMTSNLKHSQKRNSTLTKIFSHQQTSKSFSESQRSERTFYFTEQEAYSMNEHDRMILQLDSSSVPLTTLPKFMKELAEYCYLLSKYKEYTKGWKYVSNFFYSNLSNFTNEDFKFYVKVLAYTLFLGSKEDFWSKISEEFLKRNWDKQSLLELMNCFNLVQIKSHSLWKPVVDRLKTSSFSYDAFEDNTMVAAILGNVDYTAADSIWEMLLSKLENQEIKEETFDLSMVIKAASSIKLRLPERKTAFYDKVRRHIEDNFNNFQPNALYSIFTEYLKLFELNSEEVSKYVIQIVDKIGAANDYMRFGFCHQLLTLCKKYPDIIATLKENKHALPNNFYIPTEEMVNQYYAVIEESILNGRNLSKANESYNQFWEKYCDSLGFNLDFAKDMFINGAANYTAIQEIFPSNGEKKHDH